MFFGASGTARTDSNGNFTMTGVAPGDYTLNARTSQIFTSSGDGGNMTFTMMRTDRSRRQRGHHRKPARSR